MNPPCFTKTKAENIETLKYSYQRTAGRRKEHVPRGATVDVVGVDDSVIPRSSGERATISHAVFHIIDHNSLGYGPQRQHIADGQCGLLSTVDELAGIHALSGNEPLLLAFKAERVVECDLAEGGTSAGVVAHLRHHTLDITIALREVERAELSRALPAMRMGAKDGARSLTLGPDDSSHGDRGTVALPLPLLLLLLLILQH